MNVTIQLEDSLCRKIQHRAMDQGLSFSNWVEQALRKELADEPTSKSLLEALSTDEADDRSFEVSRDKSTARDLTFT